MLKEVDIMRRNVIFIIFTVACILVLGGLLCWQQNSIYDDTYISLTATSRDGECYFYTYDISSHNLSEIYKAPDTAQYPLGAVDKHQSNVYFTYRINHGDQLMQCDLKTGQIIQLTDDIYAVNQILPIGEKIYLVASTFAHPRLGLIEYDSKTKSYEILTPNSDVVMQMTYDKMNNAIMFVSYDWQEQKDLQYAYEHRDRETESVAQNAKYTIYSCDIEEKNIEKLTEMKEMISMIDVDNTGEVLLLRIANSLFESRQNVFFSLKEEKILETISMPQIERVEGIAYSPDNMGIYFIGKLLVTQENNTATSTNELIYMDFATGKYERIVSFEDKYINNFYVCK